MLWANPPSLPVGRNLVLQRGYSSRECQSDTSKLFPSFPIQRGITFIPEVMVFQQQAKQPPPPLGFPELKCSCLELSLPQEKAERVLSES